MRIAITGGIAEGKSTVLASLQELGKRTASADVFAREVFVQDDVQALLAAATGLPLPILPAELRGALTSDAGLRRRVNAIMHPLIHQKLSTSEADFIEVPLLFEACIFGMFGQVWVVTCGEVEQRKRLAARLGEGPHIDALIASQMATRAKIAFSDRVVRTNDAPETVSRVLSEAVIALFSA